jgi:hypothetical protein
MKQTCLANAKEDEKGIAGQARNDRPFRMKTKVLLLVTGILCLTGAMAQTNYYSETKTYRENGYSYQCDVTEWGKVKLYNSDNLFTNQRSVYKSDGSFFSRERSGNKLPMEFSARNKKNDTIFISIVYNALSISEKQRTKGFLLNVTMKISPETGKVVDVIFDFFYDEPFATVPIATYRKIEMELKNKLQFYPSEEGKKLNFIMHGPTYKK